MKAQYRLNKGTLNYEIKVTERVTKVYLLQNEHEYSTKEWK